MLFFYIRHGDPIYNPDSLTQLGHKQAEAVVKRLALYGIDEIYASTSNRAILTATPTANYLNKEIKLADFASEVHTWANLTIKMPQGTQWLFQTPKVKELFHSKEIIELGFQWYKHPYFKDYDYESEMNRIRKESDNFFAQLGYVHLGNGKYKVENKNDKRIALFAHQGFGVAFLPTLLGLPYPHFATHYDMCHSGITVIEFKEEAGYAYPKILTLSNDSHLFKENILGKYNHEIEF